MTKYYSNDAEVERVGLGILHRTLPKAEWTHAAHFAAALWFLRHRPEIPLANHMPTFIRNYNEATGVPNTDDGGYHETITLASIKAARAFLSVRPGSEPLHRVLDLLMKSPLGRPEWILDYWTKQLLFSAKARREWIEPDLQPLPK